MILVPPADPNPQKKQDYDGKKEGNGCWGKGGKRATNGGFYRFQYHNTAFYSQTIYLKAFLSSLTQP